MSGLSELEHDFRELGVRRGQLLMVHASLSSIGHVEGGARTVIAALLQILGERGTLVMPAFRDSISVPGLIEEVPSSAVEEAIAQTPPYDPLTTPSSMGVIAETFRILSGVRRSSHPTSSIIAAGPLADELTASHPIAWATGIQSPFHKLYEYDAHLLLLGVGFNRLTMLHYAETVLPMGRRKTRLVPIGDQVVGFPDTGDDLNTHFPAIGEAAIRQGLVRSGNVGSAKSHLMRSRKIVSAASDYLEKILPLARAHAHQP